MSLQSLPPWPDSSAATDRQHPDEIENRSDRFLVRWRAVQQ